MSRHSSVCLRVSADVNVHLTPAERYSPPLHPLPPAPTQVKKKISHELMWEVQAQNFSKQVNSRQTFSLSLLSRSGLLLLEPGQQVWVIAMDWTENFC